MVRNRRLIKRQNLLPVEPFALGAVAFVLLVGTFAFFAMQPQIKAKLVLAVHNADGIFYQN